MTTATNESSPLLLQQAEQSENPRLGNETQSLLRRVAWIWAIASFVVLSCSWLFVGSWEPTEPLIDGDLPLWSHSHHHHSHSHHRSFHKALIDLDEQIRGRVIWPSNPDFTNASRVWNQCTLPPAVVVEVADESDVSQAIPLLHQIEMEFAVPFRIRSGGHQYSGWSSIQDGIILSLSRLNALEIEFPANVSENRRAVVTMGPAVRVMDVLTKVFRPYKYASTFGWCTSVSEGGYTLGGGNGALARKLGLGLDNVFEMRIVLSNGTVLVTSHSQNPDLFWALRGAGQNSFGVVTQLKYRYHPIQDTILFTNSSVPVDVVPYLLVKLGHEELSKTVPGNLGAFIYAITGNNEWGVAFWWAMEETSSMEQGQEYLNGLLHRLLPQDLASSFNVTALPWYDMQTHVVDNHENKIVAIYNGFLMPSNNTKEIMEHLIEKLTKASAESPYSIAAYEYWGGAISDVALTDTAFYWREGIYNVRLVLLYPADARHARKEFDLHRNRYDRFWKKEIQPYLSGQYLNYAQASLSRSEYPRVTWGGNLERLVELKQLYDPKNVFHNPQSVPLSIV